MGNSVDLDSNTLVSVIVSQPYPDVTIRPTGQRVRWLVSDDWGRRYGLPLVAPGRLGGVAVALAHWRSPSIEIGSLILA
jgi:hypothetical protein